MLEKLFDKLGYNSENGLYILNQSESIIHETFPSRISRLLTNLIKPYAIFCLEMSNEYDSHVKPFNNPLILFYDNPTKEEEVLIPKHSFNLNIAPIIIINRNNSIDIYNGFSFTKKDVKWLEPIDKEKYQPLLSIHSLSSGRGWEKIYQDHFKGVKTVDQHLLSNITDARRILIAQESNFPQGNLKPEIANRLIGRLIFIRYLVDRNVVFNDQSLLIGNSKEERQKSLNELLKNHDKTYDFFEYICNKFNGDLFPLNYESNGLFFHEKDRVKVQNLLVLHHLFKGSDIFSGGETCRGYSIQLSLFEFYDFEIIPVELISNIYESFLGNTIFSKGEKITQLSKQKQVKAYYTPPFLVDYILSQTITPYLSDKKTGCKVLDPSCGSGIFLVESLRQIIDNELKWTSSDNQNNMESISNDRLWKLLEDNIFGIDIDLNALEVTIFSLYITLLDYKSHPREIENFEFRSLKNKNFFGGDDADFFNEESAFNDKFKNQIPIDFIIGNPPWGKVPKSRYVEYIKTRAHEEKIDHLSSVPLEIGNKEISQAFVIRAGDFIQETASAKICFIVKGTNFYNCQRSSLQWRKYLLNNFCIEQYFDLFGVNNKIAGGRQLFNDVRHPPGIVIYSKKNSISQSENNIKHITARANVFYNHFKTIVIEKNDLKMVNQNRLLKDDKLWKILLYGNSFDYLLIKRIREKGENLSLLMKAYGFNMKGGFKPTDSSIPKNKRKNTMHFWDYDYVEISQEKGLLQYRVLSNKTFKKKLKELYDADKIESDYKVPRLPDVRVFNGTRLLLKKGLNNNKEGISAITKDDCVFSDSVASIYSENQITNKQEDLLYMMSAIFNSKLFTYYQLMTSASFGVERNRLFFDDFLNMPMVLDNRLVTLSRELHELLESGIDHNNQKIAEVKNSIWKLIQQIYEISDIEADLIDYALEISIPLIERADRIPSKGPPAFQRVDKKKSGVLKDFADVFINHFAERFDTEERQFLSDVYINDYFVAFHFIVGARRKDTVEYDWKSDFDDIIKKIGILGINKVSRDLFVQQDVRGFNQDSFYLIKPNIAKNWHVALAHYDLTEFIEAIAKSEVKNLRVG